MFRIWLPFIYIFICLLVFVLKVPFAFYFFIVFTYPINRIFNILQFSQKGSGFGSNNGLKHEINFIDSPFLPNPIQVPTQHFLLILQILIAVLLWFLIGLIIDKKIRPILKKLGL